MREMSRTLALIIGLTFFSSQSSLATEWDFDAEPEPQEEAEGVSCMKMCLEEGEDPMECNYYCIQVVSRDGEPLTVACR